MADELTADEFTELEDLYQQVAGGELGLDAETAERILELEQKAGT